jgi:hypothetical protein
MWDRLLARTRMTSKNKTKSSSFVALSSNSRTRSFVTFKDEAKTNVTSLLEAHARDSCNFGREAWMFDVGNKLFGVLDSFASPGP